MDHPDVAMEPVNGLAARVIKPGQKYEPKKKIACLHWDAPPPIMPTPKGIEDFTGVRFGRFVVKGYFESGKGKGLGPKWLVRCDCGKYETRRAKSIKNEKNDGDRCHACRHLAEMKRREEYRRLGKNKSDTLKDY